MRAYPFQGAYYVMPFGELDVDDQRILRIAGDARTKAQAPYSGYHVGAAALFEDGIVGYGVNVENASYTQTTHAEQAAITMRVSMNGPAKLVAVAIVGAPAGESWSADKKPQGSPSHQRPCPSCGHCLQIIWENCGGDEHVRLVQGLTSGWVVLTSIGDALPFSFGPKDLGIDPFAKR